MAQRYFVTGAASGSQPGRILSFVQGCAEDQSVGENYLDQLRDKAAEVARQLEHARSTLEHKKQQKSAAEKELKSLEVELASADATVKAKQARLEAKQLEIETANKLLESIEMNVTNERDRFISTMQSLNRSLLEMQNQRLAC